MMKVEVVSLQGHPAVVFAMLHNAGKRVKRMYVHSLDEARRFMRRSPLQEDLDTGVMEAVWFGDKFKILADQGLAVGEGLVEYEQAG